MDVQGKIGVDAEEASHVSFADALFSQSIFYKFASFANLYGLLSL